MTAQSTLATATTMKSTSSASPPSTTTSSPIDSATNTNLHNSQVIKFYSNKNVLITGASGFLGKVILWKLIDTCKDIGKIYVLLRSKNAVSHEKRLIKLLSAKPFCNKYSCDELLQKVVAIESDLTASRLGLSESNRKLLQDNVNIVLHSAASVSFDAPLKDNLRDNVYGTRSIIDLCNGIANLDALVHVSTAYSNFHSETIGEELLPLKVDAEKAIQLIENLPTDAQELITGQLLEGRPNTYCYTKAVAEHLVGKQEGRYPISIVRPSIIISASQEPCPGWVDNVNGIAGLGSLAAIGILRTIDWNYYATSDMVPVDYVANNIICAAYKSNVSSPKKLLIYNMTSGSMSPISWGGFFDMLREQAVAKPPNKIVRPIIVPPRYERANPIKLLLTTIFSELLFAYFVDMILALMGYKRILVKMTRKMHHGYKILRPFTTKQWAFTSDNVINLAEYLQTGDRDLFKFDMRNFDWSRQAECTYLGARSMILKEEASEESYKTGRIRQTTVGIVHYSFIAAFIILLASLCLTGTRMLKVF